MNKDVKYHTADPTDITKAWCGANTALDGTTVISIHERNKMMATHTCDDCDRKQVCVIHLFFGKTPGKHARSLCGKNLYDAMKETSKDPYKTTTGIPASQMHGDLGLGSTWHHVNILCEGCAANPNLPLAILDGAL